MATPKSVLLKRALIKLNGCQPHKWADPGNLTPSHHYLVWMAETCPIRHSMSHETLYDKHHIGDRCSQCGIDHCVYCKAIGYFGELMDWQKYSTARSR